MKNTNVNTVWLKEQLMARGLSQRDLAAKLERDPSAISLLLTGKRKIKIDEATRLAGIFSVPLDELLDQMGYDTAVKGMQGLGMATIRGHIDKNFVVHPGSNRNPKKVPLPPGLTKDAIALRFETRGTPLSSFDGALVFYLPRKTVAAECIGKLCVVRTKENVERIGSLQHGYQSGKLSLLGFKDSDVLLENVSLLSASKVILFKF